MQLVVSPMLRVRCERKASGNPNIAGALGERYGKEKRGTSTMNTQIRPPRIGPQPWDIVRTKLDQSLPFANMRDTPYYRDCVWEQFSQAEYGPRYRARRGKMHEEKPDAVIVPGGRSHWSFGGGMLW